MIVIRGFSFQHCVNQAIALGLGIPVSSIKANGQWRFLYLKRGPSGPYPFLQKGVCNGHLHPVLHR